SLFFYFHYTLTTDTHTLSLHDALPISITYQKGGLPVADVIAPRLSTTLVLVGLATVATMWLGLVLGRISGWRRGRPADVSITMRSEEHTSELQSRGHLVCRLLLEKKKK